MNKAKEFYQKHIKPLPHIIGGSTAIKNQLPLFREPDDIDIMIEKKFAPAVKNIFEGKELKKSSYGNGIFSVLFDDESKLDIILTNHVGKNKTIQNSEGVFLKLDEIVKYKVALMDKSIKAGCFNEHNKHLKDIIYIFANLDKQSMYIEEREITEALPF